MQNSHLVQSTLWLNLKILAKENKEAPVYIIEPRDWSNAAVRLAEYEAVDKIPE
jgi:hypothetical protein